MYACQLLGELEADPSLGFHAPGWHERYAVLAVVVEFMLVYLEPHGVPDETEAPGRPSHEDDRLGEHLGDALPACLGELQCTGEHKHGGGSRNPSYVNSHVSRLNVFNPG